MSTSWPAHVGGVYSRSEAFLSRPHRPLSLHSASFHITEFPEGVNPVPVVRGRGGREGGPTYLSPSKLQELTGERDLLAVTYMELEVNSTQNSLGNFGRYLPSLRELRLTSSVVPCLRDLGTSLGSLAVLWMVQCRLKDLDGLGALNSLRELYLSYNEISDISLVAMVPSLEVLDVESNDISQEDQLGYLALCPALTTLTLDGNPLCHKLAEREGGESGYRKAVHAAVPHLRTLDDSPLTSEGGGALRSESSVFQLAQAGMDVDWQEVQRGLREGRGGEESDTSLLRPKTAPAQRPPLPLSPPPSDDDSSELTHGLGQVICGNPVRALKARRQCGLISQSVVLSRPEAVQTQRPKSSAAPRSMLGAGVKDGELSVSLQADGIPVTRARSEENLAVMAEEGTQQPDHSSRPHRRLPTPPSYPLHPSHSSSHPHPSPPSHVQHLRPKSVADFRHRRLRRLSEEEGRSLYAEPVSLTSELSSSSVHVPQCRRILPAPPTRPTYNN